MHQIKTKTEVPAERASEEFSRMPGGRKELL